MLVNSAISPAALISQLSSLAVLTVDVECSSGCGRLTHPVVSTTRVVTAVKAKELFQLSFDRIMYCATLIIIAMIFDAMIFHSITVQFLKKITACTKDG